MRLMVVVLAMMLVGVAVAEEQAQQLPEFAAFIPGMSGAVIVADYVDPAPDPKFGKPKEGNKLIAVQLIFVSADGPVNVPVNVNPMFAEIKCSDMAVRNAAMASAPDPRLSSSKITESSDRVMGWVAFEVPLALNAAECKVQYGIGDKTKWISLAKAANRQPPAEAPK